MAPYLLIAILIAAAVVSVWLGKLNIPGGITGALLGVFIYAGAGYTGVTITAVFFILATAATSWKAGSKEKLGMAEINKGRRNAAQVMANAGVAGLLGVFAWFHHLQKPLCSIMIAASIAAATSDTLSSELGNVYGRRFYNCITFKKDTRGENGVISMEGTLFGVAASAIIGIIYTCGFGWSTNVYWIVIAGITGNLADSVIGATLERKRYLHNDAVNFLNTLVAALTALLLHAIFK